MTRISRKSVGFALYIGQFQDEHKAIDFELLASASDSSFLA